MRENDCGWAQNAKGHLEKALKEAQREGCSVTESELAEHHYKLGRILWTMGGALRDDPTKARAHFEAASKEDCDSQVGSRSHVTPPLKPLPPCRCYETVHVVSTGDCVSAYSEAASEEDCGLQGVQVGCHASSACGCWGCGVNDVVASKTNNANAFVAASRLSPGEVDDCTPPLSRLLLEAAALPPVTGC